MSELIEKLSPEFQDKEYRDAYAEECLNMMIASQIKALREQREMTQKQLADATGMSQPRIPVLEDASYENWSINTLKRFARAFDLALSVKFETFSRLINDFANMNAETLKRASFSDDVQFNSPRPTHRQQRGRHNRRHRRARNWSTRQFSQPQGSGVGTTRKPPKAAGVADPSPQEINELGTNWAQAAKAGA